MYLVNKRLIILFFLLFVSATGANAQFERGIPKATPLKTEPDTLSLVFIGDVMMHSKQLEYEHREFLQYISGQLIEADFSIANLEFSLGGEPYSGYPNFSTPDSYADYLATDCGIDVFLCANNHILDTGDKGLIRTLNYYEKLRQTQGISYTGAARDEREYLRNYPIFLFKNGIKTALINFTYGTNVGSASPYPKVQRMVRDEIEAAIQRAKDGKADFIIALPHWGEEYQTVHSKEQREWAEWLISKGIDAIVGTHPHVVQDIEYISGRPVVYSLGNAVSNMSARNTRLELMLTLRLVKDSASKEKQILDIQTDYMWCSLPGMLEGNYRTILIKEWAKRRSVWLTPEDYDNMMTTLQKNR